MTNKKLLGKRIKELRKYRHYTKEQLAELINIEPCSLSAIEIGPHFHPLPILENISKALNIELRTFFDFISVTSRDKKIEEINNALTLLPDEKKDFIYRYIDYYVQ